MDNNGLAACNSPLLKSPPNTCMLPPPPSRHHCIVGNRCIHEVQPLFLYRNCRWIENYRFDFRRLENVHNNPPWLLRKQYVMPFRLFLTDSKGRVSSKTDQSQLCKWLIVVVLLVVGVLVLATQKMRGKTQRAVCVYFLFRLRDCSFCYPLRYALHLIRYERGREYSRTGGLVFEMQNCYISSRWNANKIKPIFASYSASFPDRARVTKVAKASQRYPKWAFASIGNDRRSCFCLLWQRSSHQYVGEQRSSPWSREISRTKYARKMHLGETSSGTLWGDRPLNRVHFLISIVRIQRLQLGIISDI